MHPNPSLGETDECAAVAIATCQQNPSTACTAPPEWYRYYTVFSRSINWVDHFNLSYCFIRQLTNLPALLQTNTLSLCWVCSPCWLAKLCHTLETPQTLPALPTHTQTLSQDEALVSLALMSLPSSQMSLQTWRTTLPMNVNRSHLFMSWDGLVPYTHC